MLKPRGQGQGGSGCSGRERPAGSDYELAGLNADAARRRYRRANLDCGAHRAQGVVLVRDRQAEESHEQVAHDLLDAGAVTAEHARRDVERARDGSTLGFGIRLSW